MGKEKKWLLLIACRLVAIVFFLFSVRSYAVDSKATAAKLRVGRHAGYLRLVFETTESNVQKAYVGRSSANSIKVDFHSPVSFAENVKKKVNEIDKSLNITFDSNSCIISVDGLSDINVLRLSLPSRLVIDAHTGTTTAAPSTGFSFVLDAGHGGYESGVHFEKTAEKDFTLSMAKDIARALYRKGMKVDLSRKGDQMISLRDRARLINGKSPSLLVSIHVSSRNEFVIYPSIRSGGPAAGASVPGPTDINATDLLPQDIVNSISALKTDVRIEKRPLLLLSYLKVPAVLIELPSPDKFSYDGKSRERVIETVLQVILHLVAGDSRA